MQFKLNDYHRNTPDEQLLDDLRKVANQLNKQFLTKTEYEVYGKFSSATYERRFNTWNKALILSGLEESVQRDISEVELFENLEKVWIQLGRQPKDKELRRPLSKYSTRPYVKRYGSIRKALEAFVEFMNSAEQDKLDNEEMVADITSESSEILVIESSYKHKTQRTPSLRLKVKVLFRDGNKCRLCGAETNGNAHFDHIKPWSKGGETVLENLQLLCTDCNLGKGNWEPETK